MPTTRTTSAVPRRLPLPTAAPVSTDGTARLTPADAVAATAKPLERAWGSGPARTIPARRSPRAVGVAMGYMALLGSGRRDVRHPPVHPSSPSFARG
jgi:hypothetical protein